MPPHHSRYSAEAKGGCGVLRPQIPPTLCCGLLAAQPFLDFFDQVKSPHPHLESTMQVCTWALVMLPLIVLTTRQHRWGSRHPKQIPSAKVYQFSWDELILTPYMAIRGCSQNTGKMAELCLPALLQDPAGTTHQNFSDIKCLITGGHFLTLSS